MKRLMFLSTVALTICGLTASSAQAQFGVNTEKQIRANYGYQPKTNYEPTLRTNFEPNIRASFGFKTNTSATNTVLSQRLNQLQARLPEEKKYLQEVITYVEQNKLSLALVNDSFFYCIQRYPGPLAFSYFEQILRLKAERLKQPVPAFDRSVYTRPAFGTRNQQFGQ